MTASSLLLAPHDLSATPAAGTDRAASFDRGQRQVALVRPHLSLLWRFLRRLGLSAEDADDVAQEVCLVAVAKVDLIEDGQERRFLFGIALRIASRMRRSQRTRAAKTDAEVEIDHVRSPDPPSD